MEIKIDIYKRIEWINKRVELSTQAKELIIFLMKDLANEITKKFEKNK